MANKCCGEEEANSIRNMLIKGFGTEHVMDPPKEERGATDFLSLLTGAFHSSISGVHKPR